MEVLANFIDANKKTLLLVNIVLLGSLGVCVLIFARYLAKRAVFRLGSGKSETELRHLYRVYLCLAIFVGVVLAARAIWMLFHQIHGDLQLFG